MNKKILALAVASVVAAPMAAQADVKLSGTIQAEIGSVQVADGDREVWTTDNTGALTNGGGPNKIRIDMDEKLGNGLSAIGRVAFSFNTSTGNTFGARERWVGLKGANAHIKAGRIQGIYKTIQVIDPFYSTGAQARRMGGGMSGGSAFAHSSFLNNVMELGFKYKGFSLTAQGIFDEATEVSTGLSNQGSALVGAKYAAKNWGLFGAWSHENFQAKADGVVEPDAKDNWKVGGWFKSGGLQLALQYESAENGAMSALFSDLKGDYIYGSVAYTMGNITLAGWAAGYRSDYEAEFTNIDGVKDLLQFDDMSISFAVGGIYSFSKRTIAYAAYVSSDSDIPGAAGSEDAYDWNAFAVGMRHSF